MIRINELKLPIECTKEDIKAAAAKTLGITQSSIGSISLIKKSVDCRHKNDIKFIYSVDCELLCNEEKILKKKASDNRISESKIYEYSVPENRRNSGFRPVIAGFGPCGMFCALLLARCGLRPLILERGHDVDTRRNDINSFFRERILNENSNVQFGEGGAGAFSDGKLTTGIKDGRIRFVFEEFQKHGAPDDILYSATPHIGTDLLPGVVKNIRKEIESLGGEITFGAKVTDVILANHFVHGLTYETENGIKNDIETDTLIMCIGHSARDTVKMLESRGIAMMQKPFSIGVRIEHKREYINRLQYGDFAANKNLETASYKLACHPEHGRGLYTFCMCPGGTVVMASSEKGGLCVNGMSEYKRDAENSNSALLVGIDPVDLGSDNVTAGIELQEKIERNAFELGGGDYSAPAQKLTDFLRDEKSNSKCCVVPSCPTGVKYCEISPLFPKKVTDTLKTGLLGFDRKIKGFITEDAVLTAPETRSSSPVRILRDDYYQCEDKGGLYVCGEGAGYAGGIVSAAVDGIKCAEAVLSDEHNVI